MSDESVILDLWSAGSAAPDEATAPEITEYSPWGFRQIRNVSRPTLIAFLPEASTANGTAIIICPGGAFHALAIDHEGFEVARWFQARGVAAFVLKYHLKETPASSADYEPVIQALLAEPGRINEITKPVVSLATADGLQAMKLVRQNADNWNIHPDRIGIMGFSAGGRVTTEVALNYDEESRPNFAAPIYGALWEDVHVPAEAPPLFVAVAGDDTLAVDSCLGLYAEWKKAGKPAELHVYSTVGHGFGMRKQGLPSDGWIERLGDWLHQQEFL